MRLLVIGCNHRSAPVEVRERIAFDGPAVARALEMFRESFAEAECVLLSTCNRMELYVARPEGGQPRIAEAISFIGDCHGIDASLFAGSLYSYEDVEAVRHLYRVVSSLDSMVVGETQILGQVKAAFETARSVEASGRMLNDLFQRALRVAKCVHSTGITAGRLSVGSAAVDLARQIFSKFDDKTVMMVGAGKMGEITLAHLLATQPGRLLIANRTDARASSLAECIRQRHGYESEVIPYSQWIDRLAETDILISSTGSRDPILTAAQFKPIPRRRGYRPILLIDIAVPRDIAPDVGLDDSVFLYNIDDLQAVTEASLAQRRVAVDRAQKIVEAELVEYIRGQERQELQPLVSALRQHFQNIGEQELDRVLPKLSSACQRDRDLIEQMLHRVLQKLLHNPVHRLNDHAANGAARVYADTLRALFELREEAAPALPRPKPRALSERDPATPS
jgi:glutamyl-tRNA reductase